MLRTGKRVPEMIEGTQLLLDPLVYLAPEVGLEPTTR